MSPCLVPYGSENLACVGVHLVDPVVPADVDLPDVFSVKRHIRRPFAAQIRHPACTCISAVSGDDVVDGRLVIRIDIADHDIAGFRNYCGAPRNIHRARHPPLCND